MKLQYKKNKNYFEQESERLKFRKLTTKDISSWIEFFDDNDRLHFLGMDLSKNKQELATEWINAQLTRYEKQGFGHLAVEIKETNEFIGMGGILPRILKDKNEYEIAYSLKPKYWGKGFGTEIAKQIKEFGLKNIETDRFISIIDARNIQSANVAKKNGMKVLFETEYLGMDVDVYGYSLNKTEQ